MAIKTNEEIEKIGEFEGIFKKKNFVKSYDFEDIARGAYIKNLYMGKETNTYIMRDFVFNSGGASIQSADNSETTYTKVLDLDFDMFIERTIIIDGEVLASIYFESSFMSGSGGTADAYITIKIRKWDGATETEIANGDTRVLSRSPTGSTVGYGLVKISVDKETINPGETLRITLEGYTKRNGGTVVTSMTIYHNPASNPSIVHLPLLIEEEN